MTGLVTNLPFGVGTASRDTTLGLFPVPDPTSVASFFDDFYQYAAGDWTVTNTTSHATIGLVAASSSVATGGVLELHGGASSATNDVAAIQASPLPFYFAATAELWFEAQIQLDVAANNLVLVGLSTSAATVAPSDGIYFSKAAGAATVDFVVRKSSTSTTQSAITTLANATGVKLGFYYNGVDTIFVYVDGVLVYRQTTLTNLPSSVALGQMIAMKLAATAPTTAYLYSDYMLAAQSRAT